jgi:hypothetical protein
MLRQRLGNYPQNCTTPGRETIQKCDSPECSPAERKKKSSDIIAFRRSTKRPAPARLPENIPISASAAIRVEALAQARKYALKIARAHGDAGHFHFRDARSQNAKEMQTRFE